MMFQEEQFALGFDKALGVQVNKHVFDLRDQINLLHSHCSSFRVD